MNNYFQTGGCILNASPSTWANTYASDFRGLDAYPEGWDLQRMRSQDIHAVLGLLSLNHFGFELPVDHHEYLHRGVDVAVNYFCENWWIHDRESARQMDKSKKKRGLMWFQAFSEGLLLGLLSRRMNDVERICNWVESDLAAEEFEEVQEKELAHVYKSIASRLRSTPMDGIEKLESKILKCNTPRPVLLFKAWQAARDNDQAAFDTAINNSLEFFVNNSRRGPTALNCISCHNSVIVLAARHLGITMPELPTQLEAVLIRPESFQ